jgi:hypothetical protein
VYTRVERTPPVIGTLTTPAFANQAYEHEFRFSDADTGLRSSRVWLEAGGQVYELSQKEYAGNPFSGAAIDIEQPVEVVVNPKELGIPDGEATLHAEAHDFSWLDNTGHVAIPLTIDTRPPRVSLLTGLTYVRKGGTEVAVYTVEDGVEKSGIRVGERWFGGFVDPADNKRHVAFYAIPADSPDGTQPVLVATDRAGNEAKVALVATILPREFPSDTIALSDEFMASKVAELLGSFDGSALDGYLKINREMRKENDAQLFELGQKSGPERIWSGAFVQMPNTHTGARFAERRSYVYNGQVVDTQTHMGFDFASTSHAPVPAANDGVVVFAGPLGIYGNTVVLDHGMGLFSLYGHLSEIGVEKGSPVAKGEPLGKSGTTGLAGGDHLHYGMLLDGVFIDPLEWFDAKWIAEHIEGRLAAAAALATGAAAPATR